jgi:protein SCO1
VIARWVPVLAAVLLVVAVVPASAATAPPADARPPALREVGIDQRLGESLPLDAAFTDDHGRAVTLGDYFGTKPVVLVMTYFECPMLCTLVLNGLGSTLKTMSFEPGKEFDVVAVSFDPRDTAEKAAAKKATYVAEYGRRETADGWHFLTGPPASIERVAKAAGFRYTWVPEQKQFAHAAAIMVATPDGKLARYFYGVDYAPRDLRLGLVEAADRKIGSPVDTLLLFCYQYDPATGKYGMIALNAVRTGGVVTVLAIGAFMMVMLRREHAAERSRAKQRVDGGTVQGGDSAANRRDDSAANRRDDSAAQGGGDSAAQRGIHSAANRRDGSI